MNEKDHSRAQRRTTSNGLAVAVWGGFFMMASLPGATAAHFEDAVQAIAQRDHGNASCAASGANKQSRVYVSEDVPQIIEDFSVALSQLIIEDSILIPDLNVTITITHTCGSDLSAYLQSPSGTVVQLFREVGVPCEADFANTLLDDEALVSITEGSAPYTGAYRPEGSLSEFDGEDAQGPWTLLVQDDRLMQTGTLDGWSLEIGASDIAMSSLRVPRFVDR